MQLKTKYNIGDKVFFMFNNRIQHSTIEGIEVSTTNRRGVINVCYNIENSNKKDEYKLYSSRDLLIDALRDDGEQA